MNYKNLLKQMGLALAMTIIFAACSEEDTAKFETITSMSSDPLITTEQVVYKMHLDCTPPDFEGKMTRANTDWPDNSTIYLKFGASTYGTAVYSKTSGIWTVTANSTLTVSSSNLDCTAFYFEGAGSSTNTKIELKETTSIYQGTGTYNHPTSEDIYVSAKLSPYTWRLAFKDRNVTLLGTESDLKYYTSFNPQNHDMPQAKMGNVTLSPGQYIYGIFTYSGSNENTITVNTDDVYKRTIKGNELSVKNSGVLTAPNSNNYGTLGWERNIQYTFDAQPTSLEFDASGGSKTISVTGNDSWTAASNSTSWCTLSKENGTGAFNITVSVTQNNSSTARSTTITLRGQNSGKNVSVNVTQKGKTTTECKAEPNYFVAYPYGFATDWTVSENVSKSYYTIFTKDYYDSLADNVQSILSVLLEDNPIDLKDIVSSLHDESWFVPNKDYVLCTVSYNSAGEQGELISYPFKTTSTSLPTAQINSIKASTYNDTDIWQMSISLQNNAVGYYYYFDSRDTWYNYTNDYYLSWLVRWWISTGDLQKTDTDTESAFYRRSAYATFVTWAYNSNGVIGNHNLAKASTASSARSSFNNSSKLRNGRPVPENFVYDPKMIKNFGFVKVKK